jgi:hypothetical protein
MSRIFELLSLMAKSLVFLRRVLHDIEIDAGHVVVGEGVEAGEEILLGLDGRAQNHLLEQGLRLLHALIPAFAIAQAIRDPVNGALIK